MTSVHFYGAEVFFCSSGKENQWEFTAKIDDTTQSISQALERARAQKQSSAQAVSRRTGEVEQSLTEILQAEGALLALKARIETSLPKGKS